MGVCFATKNRMDLDAIAEADQGKVNKPLRLLKKELINKLYLPEDHFFNNFVRYRFWNSYRVSLQNLEMLRLEYETMEETKKKAEVRLGLSLASTNALASMQKKNLPIEDNLLVSTWLEDPQSPHKEMEEKVLFFLNETILERQNVNDLFSREHRKLIYDKNIELMCKKGLASHENQDNLFILLDGDVKIFGLFDGHGLNGNYISGFASGQMLDFIRNIQGEFFCKKNLEKASNAEIERMIKKCFKYVQSKMKAQYKVFRRQKDQIESDDSADSNEQDEFCAESSWESSDGSAAAQDPTNVSGPAMTQQDSEYAIKKKGDATLANSLKRTESLLREIEEEQLYYQYQQQIADEEANKATENWKKAMSRMRDAQGNIIKPSPAVVKRSLDEVIRTGVNSQHGGTMGTDDAIREDVDKPPAEHTAKQYANEGNLEQEPKKKVMAQNQGGLDDSQLRQIQEQGLLQRLKHRSEQEVKDFDIALAGTTATLVIQLPKKLIVGWVGDSLVSLQKREKLTKDMILTKEPYHTPDQDEEKIRIYNSRGETRVSNFDKKSKIYVRGRMYPGLSISRSLGDLLAHHIGVKSEPNVKILELQQNDKFVIIGTEGIWSHMGPEDVGEIVAEFALKDPGTSCDLISQKVKDICHSEGQLLCDTTLIISALGAPQR